ncbi:MAG: RagB/SusD family nutrient uptake outer membrane protein [Flectobacillus sp.]|nr:RagB/SusD family nutrient uptake outer membrane protein [Flectobacillus sp.]
MKNLRLFLSAIVSVSLFSSCESVLDKEDLSQLSPSFVMSDSLLVGNVMNNIYRVNLPTWGNPIASFGDTYQTALTEESYYNSSSANAFIEGGIAATSITELGTSNSATGNYGKIRQINDFLQDVKTSPIPLATKNRFKGEALFFRAWRYFELVNLYGGVPLITEPQVVLGDEARQAALVPRSSTSDCLKQIVADLDSAAAYLPANWWSTSSNWGRITSKAAQAFKGRVLLYAASPLFNPSGDITKWQTAYDANKKAYDFLVANKAALITEYGKIWFTEVGNAEALMVTGYNDIDLSSSNLRRTSPWEGSARPKYSLGSGSAQPSWEMIKSYPMRDGKKPGESTKYVYSDQLFYKNRDPRFEATIAYNGSVWPMTNVLNNRLWTYQVAGKTVENGNVNASTQGFYTRKALRTSDVAGSTANNTFSGTDWIEIRFAEVILNLAEAAAAIGKVDESVALVGQIRKRAGIEAGTDGRYGIKAGITSAELINLILDERLIEFAFEGKRFLDMRRHRMLEKYNTQKGSKVVISIKTGKTAPTAAELAGNIDDLYNNIFSITITPNTYMSRTYGYNSKYYFFPIPQGAIDGNPKILQNNNWGGTFDPLQ